MKAFVNEPVLELRRGPVRESLAAALRELDARLPLEVPIVVGVDERTGDGLESTDPGSPGRLVAVAAQATDRDVAAAVEGSRRGATEWSRRPAQERAAALAGAASLLRERRLELAALEVRECAKPWPEADADVCEAIDFLEYYARGAVELEHAPQLIQVPGERNELRYRPRGLAAVIAPWNFPIAIPAGMTAAALATGNAVALKPAEQSPGCAWELVRALREAGVPAQVVSLLPGAGEVGAALVRHPGVHTIAFTGSAQVGQDIIAAAAAPRPGQSHVKRVVAEMGGKNCVIVDADADLDEAVPAITQSAFVYAGQKCSAASRVLVCEPVADRLLERLSGAMEVLVVGQAESLATDVPPVIEESAKERINGYARRAESEGRLLAPDGELPGEGWFCPPRAAADLPPASSVLREEIFGPLLAVERVAGVAEACDIVDELPFALTGGLFSRNPETVAAVAARTPVGNLYVNRAITGAKVGRQPFGGNRLSGTGIKAGGPHYLLQFVDGQVVTENTMRHGLAI